LATVISGYSPKPIERKPAGKYLLLGGRNINDGRFARTEKDTYIDEVDRDSFRNAIAQPGDIIITTLFKTRKLYIFQESDPLSVVNNSCTIIRAPQTNDYIISYLKTKEGQERFFVDANSAARGSLILFIPAKEIRNIEIPILPFDELQRLGDNHIQTATTDDLLSLRDELTSKEKELSTLQIQIVDITAYYEDRLQKIESQISNNDLLSNIKRGETSRLEFKSSLRWNIKAQKDDPEMEHSVLKTIAAFCNTDGGELLIGVADDGSILGLDSDHFANADKFQLYLAGRIREKLEPSVESWVSIDTVQAGETPICKVTCKPSKEDIWLKRERNIEEFYCRQGPSSISLTPRNAARYINERFLKSNTGNR